MAPDARMTAVREGVALFALEHVCCLRLSGQGAFQALDAVCPGKLSLRDTRMMSTLLLDEQARPLADLLVCRDDRAFFLLLDGLSAADAQAHLRTHCPPGAAVELEDLGASNRLLSLSGPFSWELAAAAIDPELPGLPFHTFARLAQATIFRTSRTGEYGYDLLVPASDAAALQAKLLDAGRRLDAVLADLPTLDQCALENWQFNARREGRAGVTPIELQLQWRVSYRKKYVGAEALAEHRRQGPRSRLTALVGTAPIAAGDEVTYEGRSLGRVVNAGFSQVRGDYVALALLELPYAHPGIDRYAVRGAPVRTVAPPFIDNHSLYVSPQRHAYETRAEIRFPPLARG